MKEHRIEADIEFVGPDGNTLLLDIHYPADAYPADAPSDGGLLPVVLGIPGGGWREASRKHIPVNLVEHGFAQVCIEYRVTTEAIAPANIRDCHAALRWLQTNGEQHGLDPKKIFVYGASAGGHLAALLGVSVGVPELDGNTSEPPPGCAIKAVCAVCGVTDLTRIARPEIRANFPLLYEVTEQYVGGPVAERTDLARLVSPLTYIAKDNPPLLLIHGSADTIVPVEESTEFYEALQAVGAKAELLVIEEGGHEWFAERTAGQIAEFFTAALRD